MLKRVKDNFVRGIEKVRWFAEVFSERLKIEIAIMKLLYQSDEMDKHRDELLKSIGKRVYSVRENPEKNILRDREVIEAIEEIEKLDKGINDLKQKISGLGSVSV